MKGTLTFVRGHGIALVALFVALGGTSYAMTSVSFVSSDGTIGACVNVRTGALHLVTPGSKCHGRRQQLVTWNRRGVGPNGSTGANGAPGSAGPTGGTGPTGPVGAAATKLFAQIDVGVVDQQSGGITAGGVTTNQPFSGYFEVAVTFPQNVSACVAMAALEADNSSFTGGGGTDDHALWTSISGSTVTVYRTITTSGVFPPFAITVFC